MQFITTLNLIYRKSSVNPFPEDIILNMSKLKALPEDKSNMAENDVPLL